MFRELTGGMEINISHDLSRRILLKRKDILKRFDNDFIIGSKTEMRINEPKGWKQ